MFIINTISCCCSTLQMQPFFIFSSYRLSLCCVLILTLQHYENHWKEKCSIITDFWLLMISLWCIWQTFLWSQHAPAGVSRPHSNQPSATATARSVWRVNSTVSTNSVHTSKIKLHCVSASTKKQPGRHGELICEYIYLREAA